MTTNQMMEVCLQPIQEKHVKISLLQNFFIDEGGKKVRHFRKVGEIHGNLVSGSLNLDANSAIRRTCAIEMVITDSSFLVGEDRKIWLDKFFRLELGIRHMISGEVIWFDKGIYAINAPTVTYSSFEKKLSIEGLDLMCTLDGTLSGEIGIITKLEAGISISEAIKITVHSLGGISMSNIYIEHNDYVLPYDIEKTATDTVYSILDELCQLYMDWEFFFDTGGRFIYRKIKNRNVANPIPNYENDVITFNFLEEHVLVIDYSHNFHFDNVKNKIVVWGRLKDDGEQVYAELINDDENSPFSINKNIGTIVKSINEETIFTSEQAEERARYEFYKHNNMNEEVSVSLVPLYFLDVNHLIEFNQPDIELSGKFLIDSISCGLSAADTMSLTAHKIYEVE